MKFASEVEFVNRASSDFTLFEADKIRAFIECKGGEIGVNLDFTLFEANKIRAFIECKGGEIGVNSAQICLKFEKKFQKNRWKNGF